MDEKLQELVFSLESGLSTFLEEARLKSFNTPVVPSRSLHPRQHSDDSGVDDSSNRISSALFTKLHRLAEVIGEVSEELEPFSPSVSEDEDQEERKRMVVVVGPLGTERKTGITETRFDKAESTVYSRASSLKSSFCQFHRKLRVEEVPLKDSPRPTARVCVSDRREDERHVHVPEGQRWTRSKARMSCFGPREFFSSESSTEPLSTQNSSSSDDDDDDGQILAQRKKNCRHVVTTASRLPTANRYHNVLRFPPVLPNHHSDTDSDETYLSPSSPVDSPPSDLHLHETVVEGVPVINNENEADDIGVDDELLSSPVEKVPTGGGLSEMEVELDDSQPTMLDSLEDNVNGEMEDMVDSSPTNRQPSGIRTVLNDLKTPFHSNKTASKSIRTGSSDGQTYQRRLRNFTCTNNDTNQLEKNSKSDNDSSENETMLKEAQSSIARELDDAHKIRIPISKLAHNFNFSLTVDRLSRNVVTRHLSDLVRFHAKSPQSVPHSLYDLISHHLKCTKTIQSSPLSDVPLTDSDDGQAARDTGSVDGTSDIGSEHALLDAEDVEVHVNDECESLVTSDKNDLESECGDNEQIDGFGDDFDAESDRDGQIDSPSSNGATRPLPLSIVMPDVFTSNDDGGVKSSKNEMDAESDRDRQVDSASSDGATRPLPISGIMSDVFTSNDDGGVKSSENEMDAESDRDGQVDSASSNGATRPLPLSIVMSDVFTSNDDGAIKSSENELKSSENEMENDIGSPKRTPSVVKTPTRPLSEKFLRTPSQPSTPNNKSEQRSRKLQLSTSRRKARLSASQPTRHLKDSFWTLSSDSDFDSAPLSLTSKKLSLSQPSSVVLSVNKSKKKTLPQFSDDDEKPFKSRVRLDFSSPTKKSKGVTESDETSTPTFKGKFSSTPGKKGKEKVVDQTTVPDVIECSSCGKQIQWRKKKTHVHERLKVLICEKCYKTYSKGSFSVVEGYEEYCTLCGDGGKLILCNFCNKSFCQSCIELVSGKNHLEHLLSSPDVEFTCYICDPSPLESKRQECKRVKTLLNPQPPRPSRKYSTPVSPLTATTTITSTGPLSLSTNDNFDDFVDSVFTDQLKSETTKAELHENSQLSAEETRTDDVPPTLNKEPSKNKDEKVVDRKKAPADVIECTACGKGIRWKTKAIHSHQRLQVLICEKCHNLYTTGSFCKKDGSEEYCSLCGEGGDLVMCDSASCDKSFCQPCILRVSGKDHLNYLLSSDDVQFTCYVCDSTPLAEKRQECVDLCEYLKRSRNKQTHSRKKSRKTCRSKELVDSEDRSNTPSDKDTKPSETVNAVSGTLNHSGSSNRQGSGGGSKSDTNSSNKENKGSSKKSTQKCAKREPVRGLKKSPVGFGSGDSSDGSSNDDFDDRSSPIISTDEISVSDASVLEECLSKIKKTKDAEKSDKRGSDSSKSKKTVKKKTAGVKFQRHLNRSRLADFCDDDNSDFDSVDTLLGSQKRSKLKRFHPTSSNASSDTETNNGARSSKPKPPKKRSKKSLLAEELSSGAESDAGPSRLTVAADETIDSDSDGSGIMEETLKSPGFSPVKYRTPVKMSQHSSDSDLEFSKIKPKGKARKRALLSSSSLSSIGNTKEEMKPKVYKTRNKRKKKAMSGFGSSDDDFEDEDLSLRGPRLHRRHVKHSFLSSDSSDEQLTDQERPKDEASQKDGETSPEKSTTPGKRRKKIRKLISDANLTDATKQAQKEEDERKKRLQERANVRDDFNEAERLVLEYDADAKEVKIEVRRSVVSSIKPHQREGIKFLYNSCVESLDRLKSGQGAGCILAHCMGLGKTLQVIALIDALLSCEESGLSRALILCPVNVIHNWKNEFKHWIPIRYCDYHVFVFTESTTKQRLHKLQRWFHGGGVLLMGYQMFRNLASSKRVKKKKDRDDFERFLLDPGPDIVVCDEGHIMRNSKSNLSLILNRIKTRMRIVLTGTPLQNNLLEYYTMVNFVKPNLLGTLKEFTNRFVNPITNGQCRDSHPLDIRKMKLRAHVLHEKLKDTVQRRDYRVLADCLPPKHEFVLGIRMSPIQDQLYRHFLENERSRDNHRDLFSAFSTLSKVWNHPHVLKLDEEREYERAERRMWMNGEDDDPTLDGFIVLGSEEEEDEAGDSRGNRSQGKRTKKRVRRKGSSSTASSSRSNSIAPSSKSRSTTPAVQDDYIIISSDSEEGKTTKDTEFVPPLLVKTEDGGMVMVQQSNSVGGVTQTEPIVMPKEETPPPWYSSMLPENSLDQPDQSGKLIFLMELLNEAQKLKEKVLVFTQSLLTLDLIEEYLHKPENGNWTPGLDYYRLDGSIKADRRTINMQAFNDKKNNRVRLYLISTKAGSLGVNLVAANRVIIFDACWNPSHDLQAIFRTYRYGQMKPIFVYRLLAQGTMEEKIYDRQILKQSLSMRVVDEKQIGRHYNTADLAELFTYTPALPPPPPYRRPDVDMVLCSVLERMQPKWIVDYHEHDSLLEHIFDEELSEEERKAAWDNYKQQMADESRRYNMEALQNRLEGDQRAAANAAMSGLPQGSPIDFSAYQVLQIINSLSSCIQQTGILCNSEVKKQKLEQMFTNRGVVPPPVLQLEIQSLKKEVRDGYQNLAQVISNVNKQIEVFNASPASRVPGYAEAIRNKSRELHDQLELYKQATNHQGVPLPSAQLMVSAPAMQASVMPLQATSLPGRGTANPVHSHFSQSSSSQAPVQR